MQKTDDKIGASLETSPRKSWPQLEQRMGMSASALQNATELLHLHPTMPNMVHNLYDTDSEATRNFVT